MKYKVEWRGETYTVTAEQREQAVSTFADEVHEDVIVNAVVHEYKVYRVRLNYCGSVVNVLAEDEHQAREAAQSYVVRLRREALSTVSHGSAAHTLLVDIDTGVEVEEQVDDTHYEITPSGNWEEGEIQ